MKTNEYSKVVKNWRRSLIELSFMALISTGRCSSDRELTVTEAAPIWRRLDVECIPEGCGLAIWIKNLLTMLKFRDLLLFFFLPFLSSFVCNRVKVVHLLEKHVSLINIEWKLNHFDHVQMHKTCWGGKHSLR